MKSYSKSKILLILVLFLTISINSTLLLTSLKHSKSIIKSQDSSTDLRTSEQEITIITPENKTYTGPMSGFYPATFGFENELEGTSGTTIDYVDYTLISSGCEVKIYDNYQGHNKVLRVHDGNVNGNAEAQHYFSSTHTTGTIEWWWFTPMTGSGFVAFHIHEGLLGTLAGSLRIGDGDFNDMEGNFVLTCNTNQWYHHKLIFDTNTDTYDWYIDGILRVDDGNFENPVNNVGSTNMKGAWTNTGSCYVDAVSHSWDSNYNVGDNLEEGLLLSFDTRFSPDWTAYSLDGQTNKTISGNATIPLPEDGLHAIQVFGNNSLGTMYQSNIRYFSIDTSPPEILIITPDPDEFFGTIAPNFEIFIDEMNPNINWYTIDNGITNITFSGLTGSINQTEWEKKGDISITIRFYANDTWGFEGYSEVIVYKDTTAPVSSLFFTPYSGTNEVNKSTSFTIIADDGNGSGISIRQYKINDSGWFAYTGPFDLSGYDYGDYLISYRAIDNVYNIETENMQLVKLIQEPSEPSEPIIHGYNLWILIGIISLASIIIITKKFKK